MRRALAVRNRRSWEDRSEEERLELRELPTSMTPRPVWSNDVRIDIGADDLSASDTDEPFDRSSDDELLLARHDRNWEVRMLARELDRREHRASVSERAVPKSGSKAPASHSSGAANLRGQLQSMRSLEERCRDVGAPSPSQPRSASSDDIYRSPKGDVGAPLTPPSFALPFAPPAILVDACVPTSSSVSLNTLSVLPATFTPSDASAFADGRPLPRSPPPYTASS